MNCGTVPERFGYQSKTEELHDNDKEIFQSLPTEKNSLSGNGKIQNKQAIKQTNFPMADK